MLKTILTILLAVMSSGVSAEWTKIGETGQYLFYVDSTTVRKIDSTIKMWSLFDFKMRDEVIAGKPTLSSKSYIEYDCKEEKTRRLSMIWASENMGQGLPVHTDNNSTQWSPVPPETVIEALWKFACVKQ